MSLKRQIFITVLFALVLGGCSGTRNTAKMSLDERFAYAKELFDKGKNYDARTQFQILVLNNPGSNIVDKAQFYLAECYFNLKEYITAAAEYEKLIKLYPRSPFVDDAQFKTGMAYYKLSPKASLDQKYTYKAIDAFQILLEEYPESQHVPKATEKLQSCRNKLAKKEFRAGDLYRRLRDYRAAIIYLDAVLKNFFDTKFAEDAYYWKSYCLYKTGELDEAKLTLQILLSKFPNTSFKDRAKNLAAAIDRAERQQKSETAARNGKRNLR